MDILRKAQSGRSYLLEDNSSMFVTQKVQFWKHQRWMPVCKDDELHDVLSIGIHEAQGMQALYKFLVAEVDVGNSTL